MTPRTLKQIIRSIPTSDGGGVKLRRSLGQSQAHRLDPFLMLDEFSSINADDYIAGFPDHPHRGFETVTYMLDGHMLHEDHLGNKGDLKNGGAQWMKAGRGIIHSEMPQQESGRMRGFQLWINLPAKEKMQVASYQDVKPEETPIMSLAKGGTVKIIAGNTEIEGKPISGPIQDISTKALIVDVRLPAGASIKLPINPDHNAFIYPFEGKVSIGSDENKRVLESQAAGILSLGDSIEIYAENQATAFLLLTAHPIKEPIVQYGPFVMNTTEEIEQAIYDYKTGQLV